MFILTRFFIFCANLYILTYIYLLKKNYCKCSEDWRRDFIYYYSLVYIFTVVTFVIYPELFYENFMFSLILKIIMGLLLLVNIYCLYTYPDMLDENDKCICAKNPITKFMKILGIFYILVMIFMFIYLMIYYMNNEFPGKNKINTKNVQNILIVEKV